MVITKKVKPIASFRIEMSQGAEDAIQEFLAGNMSKEAFAQAFAVGKVDFIPIVVDEEFEVRIHTVFDDCIAPTDQDHMN